jgi:hypothetical protein
LFVAAGVRITQAADPSPVLTGTTFGYMLAGLAMEFADPIPRGLMTASEALLWWELF